MQLIIYGTNMKVEIYISTSLNLLKWKMKDVL